MSRDSEVGSVQDEHQRARGSVGLCVMAKLPRVGYVNTRMQPELNAGESARLQELLLTDLLSRRFTGFREKFLFVADGDSAVVNAQRLGERTSRSIGPPRDLITDTERGSAAWLEAWPEMAKALRDNGWISKRQRGNNLGSRMQNAARHVLSTCDTVVVLGTDAPGLPDELIEKAIQFADDFQAAIIPSKDGGYVGIALKVAGLPLLSADILWGTASVLDETLSLAASLDLPVAVCDPWFDIDTVADIECELVECSNARRESLYLTAPRAMKFVDGRFVK